jgi:hypothetical protein
MQIYQEHELEAVPGLPERLPAGERILWQGGPDWRRLANEAFHVRRIAIYFALMLAIQVQMSWEPASGVIANLAPLALSATLALLALALLTLTAWLSARTTMYTLTNRRVVMRIGIVLTVSFNLPLRWIAAAHLKSGDAGIGDIALELKGSDRIAYLHLWPHARAWQLQKPQPQLRSLKDAEAVGKLLHSAWRSRLAEVGAIEPAERIPVRMPASAIAN